MHLYALKNIKHPQHVTAALEPFKNVILDFSDRSLCVDEIFKLTLCKT